MQQEFQRSQHLQPNFIHGGVRYNLQSSNWKQPKMKSPQQLQQSFLNFQDNQYAIIKNSIYCFAPASSNPNKASLYSYNFVSEQIKEWRADAETNTPQLRKKYGMVSYDGRICIFGGVKQNKYFNDLVNYCSYSNIWTSALKQSNKILPSPRIPYVFTEVQNGNLLLFGGFNQNGFITDAYLLINFVWKQLRLVNIESAQNNFGNFYQVIKKQGIKYCAGKDSIYFFGGYDRDSFSNQFYQLKVNDEDLTISISKINSQYGPRPCPRGFHSMQRLGQNNIAIFGGINGNSTALRDISVFDQIQYKWIQVYPLNSPLPPLSQPKLYYNMHQLYIIGILNDKGISRKSLIELNFPQFQIIKSQICSNCVKRLQLKEKQQQNAPKKPFISNGLIYNLAMQLNSPFQAISLLTDCAQILKATQITIRNQQTNNKLTYLDIRFNGNSLTRQQYSSIISHSYVNDPVVLQMIDKIKLGSMRLGKTLIFITTTENFRRVFVFSADGLVISHYHEIYSYFSYQQRISDQWLATQESINHKKFIINLLHSYFSNPQQIISTVKNHCILIFESNVIMTTQKIYYGELLTTASDIIQCKANKKVQFLDGLGFQLNQDPQVSLSKYLQYAYLNPNLKHVIIQNKNIYLQPNKYLEQLNKLQTSLAIKPICKEKVNIKQIQAQCWLYEVIDTSVYIKEQKGILIYFKGRLINRLDVNFGDLFWQKFYKSKYKKPFGLWSHVGIINFLKGVQPKSLRNQFKNDNYYNFFIRHIKKQYLNKSHQNKIGSSNEMDEQGKTNKLLKRQRQ